MKRLWGDRRGWEVSYHKFHLTLTMVALKKKGGRGGRREGTLQGMWHVPSQRQDQIYCTDILKIIQWWRLHSHPKKICLRVAVLLLFRSSFFFSDHGIIHHERGQEVVLHHTTAVFLILEDPILLQCNPMWVHNNKKFALKVTNFGASKIKINK